MNLYNKLCVLLSLIQIGYSAKILAVIPTPFKSHWVFCSSLIEQLTKSGHDLTVISSFPLQNPPKNYRNIEITGNFEIFDGKINDLLNHIDKSTTDKVMEICDVGYKITSYTLNHPNIKNLLKSNETFDLVIVEIFLDEALLGFGQFYKAPVVALSTLGGTKWINDMLGSSLPISYVPNLFLGYTDFMSFGQRLFNGYIALVEHAYMDFIYMHKQEKLYNEVFPDPKPSFQHVFKHGVSLGLLNSHFSLSFPQPYLPNMIEVGGMHVNTNSKPLPENIKKFIESAKDGVVYFSMGSNLRPSKFPKERLDGIYNALNSVKQKVLMKWDAPDSLPKNDKILVSSWFPQDDILAHPNVKLFITHGGLLSCTESIYHGTPVIGIPFFGDQSLNMARVVSNGFGVRVDYKNLTEESLKWALHEVLGNNKYKIKAQEISTRFRDQPEKPLERAKFWVEYVIRHKGAPHLHSSGQSLSFIQYHMIDVWLTLLAIVCSILGLFIFILRKILNKVFGKTSSKHSKKD